ncbi:unnamed protein product [Thelazia callipaeda]|uniref:Protein kinase domain-containing protein n=1 Tax=Thelazia callipaeda TaxID=103827 RepID=A0A158RCS3_THECL|nr:unnamed protein product [Thelazia callipaeda]
MCHCKYTLQYIIYCSKAVCACTDSIPEQAGKSSDGSASDLMSWAVPTTNVNYRMRRIQEMLARIPYFFGSLLDDDDLQTQLLAEPGDTFLISCPKTKNAINPSSNWYLVVLEPSEVILKVKVVYLQKTFKIWSDKSMTLFGYIQNRLLKPIERPWHIHPQQLSKKMAIVPQHAFPINNVLFPLGKLSQKTLNFDLKRWIPVMELSIIDCSPDEVQLLLTEAHKLRQFGTVRIWRLWGVCEYPNQTVSIILEDIIYGSVAEFIRTSAPPQTQLNKFGLQIVEGLRDLEKFGFIHHRLSIDICLLTYKYNVKIAIYGLTSGELYPKVSDLDDVDHCRWLPPECLPISKHKPEPYTTSGMIYSFGMILWSIFHGGMLPFEDEPANNIQSRKYRIENPLFVEPEIVPNKIRDVSLKSKKVSISSQKKQTHLRILITHFIAINVCFANQNLSQ